MPAPNSPKENSGASGGFLPKPLFFKKNFTPAKSRKQGVFFFRGCRGSARQWRNDASIGDSFQATTRSAHEISSFRQGSARNAVELFIIHTVSWGNICYNENSDDY